jgi:murein DD-endopeptidase MepM/ murein hydrolase activator NlpD
MLRVVELRRRRHVPQVAALALMSISFAGCSADTTRFAANPFSNSPSSSEATGSVPTGRVESHPLPQYQPTVSAPQTMPAQQLSAAPSSGVSGGGRGLASYTPPARPIETTGAVGPKSVAATSNWNRDDGAMIIVGTNDTVDSISQRYGVPAREIMKANGLPTPRAIQPGQSLFIPRPQQAQAQPKPAPVVAAAAPGHTAAPVVAPAPVQATGSAVHYVNSGETLMSIARKNHMTAAQLGHANNLPANAPLKVGMKLIVPGAKVATVTPAMQATVQPLAQAPVAGVAAPQAKPQQVAQVTTIGKQMAAAPAPVAKESAHVATETKEIEQGVKAADATSGLPTFRWPVRGRVIAGYGAKTSGKQNDGINVAVPEGTPVKAADDGVVTYAGNELKGYGNLVLVKHSNGYVTAYAHTSELMVKRGDTIKRGQIIAKSGQTGEVQSPQLHFEIRKGSTPVDPTQFLNGA